MTTQYTETPMADLTEAQIEAIANIISGIPFREVRRDGAARFAFELDGVNTRFNRARFMEACKV